MQVDPMGTADQEEHTHLQPSEFLVNPRPCLDNAQCKYQPVRPDLRRVSTNDMRADWLDCSVHRRSVVDPRTPPQSHPVCGLPALQRADERSDPWDSRHWYRSMRAAPGVARQKLEGIISRRADPDR